jgi:hypothetical protein
VSQKLTQSFVSFVKILSFAPAARLPRDNGICHAVRHAGFVL